MQTLNCTIGKWRAEARVQEVEYGKLMAIISVTGDGGNPAGQSKHTVVFEHEDGNDTLEETRVLVQRLLHARYGPQ
jgi:uncharacterized protein YndB with AHSA1/START domain